MKNAESDAAAIPNSAQNYDLKLRMPAHLTEMELAACVSIIRQGEAVDIASARRELPNAKAVVLVYCRRKIIGVGALKRFRPRYVAGIGCKCGVTFPTETLEMGYVAIDPVYRGQKLSYRIVEALLSGNESCLFATTSAPQMKTVLAKSGFTKNGNEWQGRSAQLSCWLWKRPEI